jgi:putative ABC transport system permease protein
LTLQLQASGSRFSDAEETHRYFANVLEAIGRVPGVLAAGLTSQLPLSGDLDVYGVRFASSPAPYTDEDRGAFRYAVTPGYFAAMGIALKRGRLLDERDTASAPYAIVLNESFAKRRFPGLEAIGQRLRVGPDSGPWFTVIGLVGDVRQTSLAVSQADAVYITTTQWHFADRTLSVVVRTLGDAAALAPAIRQAVASVDRHQPITRVMPMERLVERSETERRFGARVFEGFSLMALVLAAVGIYGLLSAGVAERWREFGIRSALGASRGNIVRMIVRQGMVLTTIGVAGGLLAALFASRAVATLLFGISPLDGVTYAGVVLLAASTSILACALPALRAARIDPSSALRME